MGMLGTAWNFVKSAGKTVYSLAEKAYKFCTGDNASTAYDELRERLEKNNNSSGSNIESRNSLFVPAFGNQEYISKNESDTKRDQLMFEYTRLRTSAELIDRITKHIKIHASNLSVHYESMKNITSLIEQGKRSNRILE